MKTAAKPKKRGNSIDFIIPKDMIEKQKITLSDELIIHVEKKADAERKIYNTFQPNKDYRHDTQKLRQAAE